MHECSNLYAYVIVSVRFVCTCIFIDFSDLPWVAKRGIGVISGNCIFVPCLKKSWAQKASEAQEMNGKPVLCIRYVTFCMCM